MLPVCRLPYVGQRESRSAGLQQTSEHRERKSEWELGPPSECQNTQHVTVYSAKMAPCIEFNVDCVHGLVHAHIQADVASLQHHTLMAQSMYAYSLLINYLTKMSNC